MSGGAAANVITALGQYRPQIANCIATRGRVTPGPSRGKVTDEYAAG